MFSGKQLEKGAPWSKEKKKKKNQTDRLFSACKLSYVAMDRDSGLMALQNFTKNISNALLGPSRKQSPRQNRL